MTATEQFIETLETLKPGDLGQLRTHAGLPLDESVDGFDLFAGLWWPLRKKNQKAPRREVAWLIAKLYAYRRLPQSDAPLAVQLGRLKAATDDANRRRQERFDELLMLPLGLIEPALQWAITLIADNGSGLNWVRLTDDLSIWEREETRCEWAKQYMRVEN
jgi:CRISPR type I-E-associated protein CasB/Cse2